MKKLLILITIALFILLPVTAFSAESGTCGDNLTWTLDDEGTLTISGTGDMWGYDVIDIPWYTFRSNIEKVIIGDYVTSIGYGAFETCRNLKNVNISDSVTSIGDYAFYFCHRLIDVTIGNNVISIGKNAFDSCSELEEINIPNSVTSIGY